MRFIFTILLLTTISPISFAQKLKKVDTLKVANIDLSKFKSKVKVDVLVLEDGSILEKGSELVIGNVADEANVDRNFNSTEYSYVFADRFSILGAMAEVGLPAKWKGEHLIVDNILLYKTGKRRDIVVNFTKKDGSNVAMGKYGNIRNIEDALNSGEIINPNRAMTRGEAIKKLKESKDLLDLDMMTQEEYDRIKEELTPIIKE